LTLEALFHSPAESTPSICTGPLRGTLRDGGTSGRRIPAATHAYIRSTVALAGHAM
jgi:hypothetical protein